MKPRLFPVFTAPSLKKSRQHSFPAAAVAAAITFAASPFAAALTVVWDGGAGGTGTDIGTAANWAGDTLPSVVTPDTAEWNGTATGPLSLVYSNAVFAGAPGNGGINLNITSAQTEALNIDSGANTGTLRMNGLAIASGAGAFSLGNAADAFNLTLGGAAGTHTWTNGSTNAVTIASEVTWGLGGGGAHILALGGTGNWNFNNPIGQGTGTLTLAKSGTGTANLAGTSPIAAALSVENGTVNLSGTHTTTNANIISVGTVASQNGILNVTGTLNANKNTIPSIGIGTIAGSRGFVKMSSGAISTGSELHIGRGTGAYAALSMSGGTLTSANWLCVGLNNDRAVLNQSGGSISVTANRMTIGAGGAGSIGVANLSGGTFTNSVGIFVGENGTGTLNISGNATATIGDVKFAGNASSLAGTINLLGGTLTAGAITKGNSSANGVYEFNFNGGTLKASSTNANFLAELANTSAYVRSGGANIDTNGFDVTVTEPLIAPTGNGVTAPTVTNGGTGYVDTPVVTIARGGSDTTGTGATAVANVTGGVVTSITITNRGTGYTDTPVFTLSGGGATTEATVTANANTANTGGGLTKTGAGILTLGADNTYPGPTLVSAGTLTLGTSAIISNSSAITLNGADAKLVKANNLNITRPVIVTQGSIDGYGVINSATVANLTQNTLNAGNGANGTLSFNTLTFQGAATVNVVHTAANVTRGFFADNLVTNSAGKVVVNATNTNGTWQAGDYPVIQYGTSFTGAASHFLVGTVTGLSPQQTATIANDGASIVLRIVGDSLTWTGTQNSNWGTTAVGGSFNWQYPSNSQNSEFTNGNPVLFNDSATRFNVNLTSNVSPSTTVFDNNSPNDYTLSSTGNFGITGGSLIKNGDGMVTITTTNTYTGSTTINAGVLQLGDGTKDGSIATSGLITTNGGELVFNLIGSHTYANPLAGSTSGIIQKKGGGSLTLAGANTFAGDLVLEAGILNLNSPTALGAATGFLTIEGGSINNTSGAALTSTVNKPQKWEGDFTFTGTHDLFLGTGAVTVGGAGTSRTITVTANTLGSGGITSPNHRIVKAGAGTLRLSGVSTINNIVEIQAGAISSTEDFFADGLAGTGIFENGSANTKWSFWTIAADQTSDVLIRNGGGAGLLGLIKRGAATWTLTNNANNATGNLAVDTGKLILNNTGSYGVAVSATNLNAIIGNTADANGVLEINGATVTYNNTSNADLLAYRNTLTIANNATGAGAVHMSSGSLTTFRQLSIGSVAGAYGDYTQSGGTASVGGFLALGLGTGTGTFNQTGGTFNMTTSPVTNGAAAGSRGEMNIGGSAIFNVNGTADNGLWVGETGTGILNVSGSAALNFVATNNGIQLGRNAAGIGTVNLNGGTVTLPRIYKGAGAGTLNFNGGVLAANAASATFLTGLTNAFVYSGGGGINNGGNAITIGQALLAPAGNGISASGLTVAGTGFIGTPVVQVTGDGTGATAVANVNSSGALTGITITSPGTGYTTAPAFALVGGGIGSTGTVEGSAALVANTGGSMTFSGAGVTTLTAVNTYTGNTSVSTGSTLALADNAALRFVPGANGTTNKVTGAGTAFFYGDFNIELGGAAIANGNSWTLVDVTARTFDPLLFTIPGFTQASDVWTRVDGNNTWTFTEATGVLSLQVIGGGGGYASWATANAGGEPATGDFDKDGVENGVEYFMGATGSSFTANPSLVNGKVTWPKDPAYNGTYTVQTSPNLVTWTDAASTVVGNNVEYTPATGAGKVFVRLTVNPN